MKNNLVTERARTRYHHLDAYKGFCMLLIILTHFRWEAAERLKFLFPFWVDMAVPVLMVITGYLYALSFQKKDLPLKYSYKISELLTKWLRFVIPFVPVLVVELCAKKVLLHDNLSAVYVLKSFAVGGYGPGSYYFPVMLQVVVLLPIIIVSIKKYRFKGLVLWFGINVLFETIKTVIGMGNGLYRLLSFRYLFILSYGVYLYYYTTNRNKVLKDDDARPNFKLLFVGGAGLLYVTAFNYFGYKPVITALWTNTSVFAVLWVVPITYWLFKQESISNQILEVFGQASFETFLVQMVYYYGIARYVYRYFDNPCLQIMFGFVFCFVFGVVYYRIENPIQQRVIDWIKKKSY